MNVAWSELGGLVRESLSRPRTAMRRILDAEIAPGHLWQALVLVAVMADLILWGGIAMTPQGRALLGSGALPGPVVMGLLQLALLTVIVPLIHHVGRGFGGTGDGVGALKVVVWWQVVVLTLQVVQLVLELVLPGLAVPLGYLLFAIMFWLLSSFIAELHGFRSVLGTFFGVVGTLIVLAIILSLVLGALGVAVVPGPA